MRWDWKRDRRCSGDGSAAVKQGKNSPITSLSFLFGISTQILGTNYNYNKWIAYTVLIHPRLHIVLSSQQFVLLLYISPLIGDELKAINAPSLLESPTSNLIRFAHLEPPFPARILGFRLQRPSSDSFLASWAGSPQSLVAATPPDHSARLPMQDEDPMQR